MVKMRVREDESVQQAVRRFRKLVEYAGIKREMRRREFYEKPTSIRKRKAAAAVKRHAKKVQRESRRMERLY